MPDLDIQLTVKATKDIVKSAFDKGNLQFVEANINLALCDSLNPSILNYRQLTNRLVRRQVEEKLGFDENSLEEATIKERLNSEIARTVVCTTSPLNITLLCLFINKQYCELG